MRTGVAQIVAQYAQGIGALRLFQHVNVFQAHAQVGAQGRLLRVAGMQHLQVIPSQLQAQFHRPGVLFGAAAAAGAGVGTD
ncbi:hypothetical protein D3C76_1466090 [compost metagenome]